MWKTGVVPQSCTTQCSRVGYCSVSAKRSRRLRLGRTDFRSAFPSSKDGQCVRDFQGVCEQARQLLELKAVQDALAPGGQVLLSNDSKCLKVWPLADRVRIANQLQHLRNLNEALFKFRCSSALQGARAAMQA